MDGIGVEGFNVRDDIVIIICWVKYYWVLIEILILKFFI